MKTYTPLTGTDAKAAARMQNRLVKRHPVKEGCYWTTELDPIINPEWEKAWVSNEFGDAAGGLIYNTSGGWPQRPGWPYPVYQKGVPADGGDMDWTPMFGDRIKSSGPGLTEAERIAKKKRERAIKK